MAQKGAGMEQAEHIFIVSTLGSRPEDGRIERGGFGPKLAEKSLNAVSVAVLKDNVARFFSQLHEILDTGAEAIGAFEVSQVEVSAQITGSGQVCLLGSGGKVELEGGIKFVLKRVAR